MERTRRLVRQVRWETRRKRGRVRYVFIDHMLRLGAVLFVVLDLLLPLIDHRLPRPELRRSLADAALFLGLGGLYGMAKWWINEHIFSRSDNSPQDSSP